MSLNTNMTDELPITRNVDNESDKERLCQVMTRIKYD